MNQPLNNEFWIQNGITNRREQLLYMRALHSLPHFCEYFFKSPRDDRVPLVLEEWQEGFLLLVDGKTRTMTRAELDIILKCARGFGKSVVCSAAAAGLGIRRKLEIGLFSPSQRQSDELMDKVRWFVSTSPFRYMIAQPNNMSRLKLTNGTLFKAAPCSENIRGWHINVAIMDEMSRMDDEIVKKTIRPMLRNIGVLEIGLSTPFGMRGEFFRSYNLGKRGLGYDVVEVDPMGVSWMTTEQLEKEKVKFGPLGFRQEVLGEFLPTGDCVFNATWVWRSYDKKRHNTLKNIDPKKHKYIMGVDYGRDHDWFSIVLCHKEINRQSKTAKDRFKIIIDYVESYKDVSYIFMRKRIGYLIKLSKCILVVPDGTGLGEPALDELEYYLKKEKIRTKLYGTWVKSRNKMRLGYLFTGGVGGSKQPFIEQMANFYENGMVRCPYWHGATQHQWERIPYKEDGKDVEIWGSFGDYEIYKLECELIAYSYEMLETCIKFGVQTGEHDDRLIALGLAMEGLKKPPYHYVGISGGNESGKSNNSGYDGSLIFQGGSTTTW